MADGRAKTVRDVTDPMLPLYRTVPAAGPGVCVVCHRAPSPPFTRCWSCQQTMGQVSRPVSRVVPISLTEGLGQLHHVLKTYKSDVTAPATRAKFTLQVGATVGRFVIEHGACIAPDGWDIITIVPSSRSRPGEHPLEQAILRVKRFHSEYRPLLVRGPGSLAHNVAADDGYSAAVTVRERRVLLVDDTFTSGARLQSAASALSLAGADVVAAVVVGRYITPESNAASRELWDNAGRVPFSFDRCCLE